MSKRIPMKGDNAPTKEELLATCTFLNELIESWPDTAKNEATEAVAGFAKKMDYLCCIHNLRGTFG